MQKKTFPHFVPPMMVQSAKKPFYSVTFARTYVDDDNKYHDTDSLGRDDLPLVGKLADQGYPSEQPHLAGGACF
jgi:hypothetical protein